MSWWQEVKQQITESQVWTSIFRHGYDDTPRNRILMVSGNIWLHLHPSKVRRHATRMRFTWCMGGITFLMFLVTVVTGVYLMFYYRPVAQYAYADMKYLEFDMPFGMLMRNMHRWEGLRAGRGRRACGRAACARPAETAGHRAAPSSGDRRSATSGADGLDLRRLTTLAGPADRPTPSALI